jgi:hypothetical protein
VVWVFDEEVWVLESGVSGGLLDVLVVGEEGEESRKMAWEGGSEVRWKRNEGRERVGWVGQNGGERDEKQRAAQNHGRRRREDAGERISPSMTSTHRLTKQQQKEQS